MSGRMFSLIAVLALTGCTKKAPTTPTTIRMPTASVQPGNCGEPGRDGVMSNSPKVEHADRDLDSDGQPEIVVVDRAQCTSDGNCYWNVFRQPHEAGDCARYAGTLAGANLEMLQSRGEDNMTDVRTIWAQSGGRMLLQSYRFVRDGYRIEDVLQCKRAPDDRLECADTNR
ncbi:MAG TPA: hypothetical protein VLB44_06520 [Kofleriaceae bacterium]|nr:hypothetical protein [Kofleriaceae bacterium]